MRSDQSHSLRQRFRKLSIRWSLVGLALTFIVVVPTVIAVIRHSSEREVEVMATALGRAFRPLILQDQIRDAQLQMEAVAKLKSDESVTLLDKDFKSIYLDKLGDKASDHCRISNAPCWLTSTRQVSISLPIYFDDDLKSELYGYLVLKLNPSVDWFEIFLIALGGGLIFFLQVRGIYSALKRESSRIEEVLSSWKGRVDNPRIPEPEDAEKRLFAEFLPLDESISSLHRKIAELESVAASKAASKAKVDIVRGIGHDLKTPLSQLSKFFSVFVSNTKMNRSVDEKEVERMERTMKLMGSLIRQVTTLGKSTEVPSHTNLTLWMTAYHNELKSDPELCESNLEIYFEANERDDLFSKIHETDLFRLVDNLIRNALEALPSERPSQNTIAISLKSVDGQPVLAISDNGSGIPQRIQHQIFDLDFTTKNTRGTGLGLGIAKKICTDLGLRLSFTSKENFGTTFTVEFIGINGLQRKSITGEAVL
jgi:signal transduction histidine kinase